MDWACAATCVSVVGGICVRVAVSKQQTKPLTFRHRLGWAVTWRTGMQLSRLQIRWHPAPTGAAGVCGPTIIVWHRMPPDLGPLWAVPSDLLSGARRCDTEVRTGHTGQTLRRPSHGDSLA